MASICAGRCMLSHIDSIPRALYTYGSPRVGNKRYINNVKVDYTRWVNNNDIVTRVPPAWMGYSHNGNEMYLNAYGEVRKITAGERSEDLWRGFWMALKKGRVDSFEDHSIDRYIDYIVNYVEEQEAPQH